MLFGAYGLLALTATQVACAAAGEALILARICDIELPGLSAEAEAEAEVEAAAEAVGLAGLRKVEAAGSAATAAAGRTASSLSRHEARGGVGGI